MDDKQSDTSDRSPSDEPVTDAQLNRRSYLASAATALSAVGLASTTASASGEEYDVITLDPGETITYDLDDGETLENLFIDQTARGARYQIKARDIDNATVRNVGWYGSATDRDGNSRHLLTAAANSGGEIVFENIYMSGKLTSDDEDSDPSTCGGIRVAPRHEGTVYIRHTYVEGFGNNASYADSVGEAGRGGGTLIYENCFHRNNTVSNYRIGTSSTELHNCIGLYDDENGDRGGYPYSGSRTGRNVWFWHQDGMEAHNCCFHTDPNDYAAQSSDNSVSTFHGRWYSDSPSGDVRLYTYDCYINDDTPNEERMDTDGNSVSYDVEVVHNNLTRQSTATVLEDGGIPTSAEMAASGGREYVDPFDEGIENGAEPPEDDEDDEVDLDDDEHLLAFITEPDAQGATYEFEAAGPVEFATAPYDSPSGGSIEGGTWRSRDFVEETDEGTWRAGGGTGSGSGDAYRVDGPITEIEIDDPDGMWVELDGEELSPEEIIEATAEEEEEDEETDAEERLLAFVTEPDAQGATYEFEAAGPVEFATAPYDSPSGGTIEGGTWRNQDFVEETDEGTWRAGGGTGGGFGDAFHVSGPITKIEIDDPDGMWVELDGEELSPEEIIEATAEDNEDEDAADEDGPSNVIVIDATASPDSVSYAFSVSESLEPATYDDATINDSVDVDDNSVEGTVDEDVDAYWFSGTFTSFRLTGNADVSVEYDVR